MQQRDHLNLLRLNENLVRQNGLVLKALEELSLSQHALRDSEERHFRELLSAIDSTIIREDNVRGAVDRIEQVTGPTKEAVDRLLLLVEPKAERLQKSARPAGDWDSALRDNLKQFEE